MDARTHGGIACTCELMPGARFAWQVVERLVHVLTSGNASTALRVYALRTLKSLAVACSGGAGWSTAERPALAAAVGGGNASPTGRVSAVGVSAGVAASMSLSPSSSGRIGARGGGREAGGGARETFVRLHQALLRVLDDVIADRGEEAEDVAGREAVGNEALAVLGELAFDATHRRLMLADACVLSLLRVLAFRGPHPGLVPPREREAHSRNDGSAPLQQQHRLGMRESKSESCLVHSDPCGVAAGLAEGEGAGAGAGAGAEGGRWRRAAQRVLAILGDNRFLSRALQGGDDAREDTQAMLGGSRSASCMASGVRVLAVDGGGVKGIASIRMLRALEEQCGRRLCEVFDLVVGTSAGGIIVSGIASGLSAGEIERIYSFVVDRAFSRPKSKRAAGEGEAEGGGGGGGQWGGGWERGQGELGVVEQADAQQQQHEESLAAGGQV